MTLQDNGKIAFFFEEAPCYGDDQAKGYCMVYVPLSIEEITGGRYITDPATDTGINQLEVNGNNRQSTAVYDMLGRRIETPAKGIYIVNGRKFVIK
jgi:hypothetical protein